MDRALTLIGTIGTALSFLPVLPDPVRWVIFAVGMTVGLGGLAHMVWERRAAVAGWVSARQGRVAIPAPPAAQLLEYISLYEVALQAYERTRGSFMARSAEQLGASGPVGWYAQLIETEITLYGRRLPSRIIERFAETGFYLEAEGLQIVARKPWSEDRWEDISIRADEMPRALSFIEERAAVLDK